MHGEAEKKILRRKIERERDAPPSFEYLIKPDLKKDESSAGLAGYTSKYMHAMQLLAEQEQR